MNLVHEGVLDPNEPDLRDEKREAEEARRKRETLAVDELADKVREIAAIIHTDEFHEESHDLERLADEIKAAWKREREELREAATEKMLEGATIIDNRNREQGNTAAIRDALKTIHDKVNSLNEECGVDPVEIRDIARAALAAPARNCDLYATAEEALKAHGKAFDDSNFEEGECKLGCPGCDDSPLDCKILWLFAPAAEQKGNGDDD